MSVKVVITGSHGVGKSTLTLAAQQQLAGRTHVSLIPETARLLVEMGYEVNDRIGEDGVIAYLELYLKNSRAVSGDIVLSDRSIFDLYVYTHRLAGVTIKKTYIDLVKELVFAEVRCVSRYIYLPIEFPMACDGLRPEDVGYQQQIDEDVRTLLKYFGARTITVAGSMEQRLAAIIECVDALHSV